MRIPKVGEWWSYTSTFPHRYTVTFIIEDVIYRTPHQDSWVIYSNNDNCDYFVDVLDEFFSGDWEFSHDG